MLHRSKCLSPNTAPASPSRWPLTPGRMPPPSSPVPLHAGCGSRLRVRPLAPRYVAGMLLRLELGHSETALTAPDTPNMQRKANIALCDAARCPAGTSVLCAPRSFPSLRPTPALMCLPWTPRYHSMRLRSPPWHGHADGVGLYCTVVTIYNSTRHFSHELSDPVLRGGGADLR